CGIHPHLEGLGDRIPAAVRGLVRLSARCPWNQLSQLWADAFDCRAGGGAASTVDQPENPWLSSVSDDGAGHPVLYGRLRNDWVCAGSRHVYSSRDDHYDWRNDHLPHKPGDRGWLRASRNARALYGHL